MFDVRHPEANPLLFRSIVGPAGITKKGYRKDFKDKKNHYLAFQRALVSLEPLPPQVAAPIAAPPLQRVQSYPPASASFMPSSLLARSSAMPSSAMPSSAMPSRDLDDRIRELQVKITQALKHPIQKKVYQIQLADLLRQQQQQQQQQLQQQQQQQQLQQDNGGGKKYKKQSYKKRSTKKKQSTKKRSYKKRSKSIKRKAGGGRLPVFQQLAQGQGISQDTDPDFWRRKGMIDRTSRERRRFQQETAWSGEDTDTE